MIDLIALQKIVGADYVLTDDATRKWAQDWTGAYTGTPLAVARPGTTAEVSALLKWANQTGTAIVPVSGNTGLNGGAYGANAVMLSLDRFNTINIDAAGRTATVGAGVILSQLHDAAAAHDLIFPMTFGAKGSAMMGGLLSTNAGGSNVVRYGNTRDLVLGIEAVMPNGDVMSLMGALHKDNSGLNLKHLLIGAEGILGVITACVVKLSPTPKAYATATVATPSLPDALALLHRLQDATGGAVEAFEFMPSSYIDGHLAVINGAKPPFDARHDVNILIELGATGARDATIGTDGQTPIAAMLEETLADMLESGGVLDAIVAQSEAQRREMWARREAAAEIAFHKRPFVDTDIAVALPQVAEFLDRAKAALAQIDPGATDLAVAHLGDGNIHYTAYPTRDDPELTNRIKEMVEDIVQDMGGSFSAEHGVGLSKLKTMKRRKDPVALATMHAIKAALDPNNILNPGKTLPALTGG